MTRDEVIRMAREAGAEFTYDPNGVLIFVADEADMELFASLVAAAEREECAKLCETMITQIGKITRLYDSPTAIGCENGLTNAAAAIRARGGK